MEERCLDVRVIFHDECVQKVMGYLEGKESDLLSG